MEELIKQQKLFCIFNQKDWKGKLLTIKTHNNIRHKTITKKMLIVILTLFIKIQIMILVSG